MKSYKTVNESNKVENIIICPYLESCKNLKDVICNQDPSMCSLFVRGAKRDYPKGTRIKLLSMMGEHQMHPGTIGVVVSVDYIGQVHMKWNNGSRLALNVYMDKFEKLND